VFFSSSRVRSPLISSVRSPTSVTFTSSFSRPAQLPKHHFPKLAPKGAVVVTRLIILVARNKTLF
jgi:hypothetical protein